MVAPLGRSLNKPDIEIGDFPGIYRGIQFRI